MDLGLAEMTLIVLFALAGGIVFARFKQPPILGYILCGIILGPSGFSFVSSREHVQVLSELGIVFLMFVVGFELRLSKLKDVWKIAIGCAIGQIVIGLAIMYALSFYFKWSLALTILIGFIMALSSTSAIIKILETFDQTETENGQRTIAILIAQDLAIIPMIMILQNVVQGHFDAGIILKVVLSFGLIGGLIVFLTTIKTISLPFSKVVFRDKELVTLTSFAFCVAASWVSGQLGLSPAFGAFLAGLFLGNTEQHRILLDTIKPVQTLLLTVFFFSVGAQIDTQYVLGNLWSFLLLLSVVTIGKSIANVFLLHFLRLPWSDAFVIGILLAQIGEFSFILVDAGKNLKILLGEESVQIISLTVLSLAFSPIWIKMIKKMLITEDVSIISFNVMAKYLVGRRFTRAFKVAKAFLGLKK